MRGSWGLAGAGVHGIARHSGAALLAGFALIAALALATGTARAQALRVSDGPLFTPRDEAEMEQRLHDDIDSLTFDHVRGVYRSRHGRRVDTFLDALPFLERRLSGQVLHTTSFFGFRVRSRDVERNCFYARISDTLSLGLCNVRANRPAGFTTPGRPIVILCSHYDSDGRLTGPNWHFESDPAPGADDAASGCAAVLELMDQATGLDLPFVLEGRLFGGEEFGLLGSQHEADAARARGDSILAVINFDQLAYAPRLDSLFVVTSEASAWLADSLVRVSRRAWSGGPPLIAVVQKDLVENSDHVPYLQKGYPGVMLVEAPQPLDYNKTTETVADTLGNLRMSAIRRAVELISRWLRELSRPVIAADPAPEGFTEACGRAPIQTRIKPVGDTLFLPPVGARVIAGSGLYGNWKIVDRMNAGAHSDSRACVGGTPSRLPEEGRRLGVISGELEPGLGSRLSIDSRRAYPVLPGDFGLRYASTRWQWHPGNLVSQGDVEQGGVQELVEIRGPSGAPWDLGVTRNPFYLARGQSGPVVRLNLPLLTPVACEVFSPSGRLLLRRTQIVRESLEKTVGYGIPLAGSGESWVFASGVYFYRLTLEDGRTSHGRFMLLK